MRTLNQTTTTTNGQTDTNEENDDTILGTDLNVSKSLRASFLPRRRTSFAKD